MEGEGASVHVTLCWSIDYGRCYSMDEAANGRSHFCPIRLKKVGRGGPKRKGKSNGGAGGGNAAVTHPRDLHGRGSSFDGPQNLDRECCNRRASRVEKGSR